MLHLSAKRLRFIIWWENPIWETFWATIFKGPIIPFGSLVEYHTITAKDQSGIHQFGKKVLLGLFLGYALHAGWIWKGDVLVADIEELETVDASEIYSKKTQCEIGDISQREWKKLFCQPQMDESNFSEEIKTWEHPPLCGIVQFEEKVQEIFLENQKGLFHHLTTHFRMPVKRWMIFWSMSGNLRGYQGSGDVYVNSLLHTWASRVMPVSPWLSSCVADDGYLGHKRGSRQTNSKSSSLSYLWLWSIEEWKCFKHALWWVSRQVVCFWESHRKENLFRSCVALVALWCADKRLFSCRSSLSVLWLFLVSQFCARLTSWHLILWLKWKSHPHCVTHIS